MNVNNQVQIPQTLTCVPKQASPTLADTLKQSAKPDSKQAIQSDGVTLGKVAKTGTGTAIAGTTFFSAVGGFLLLGAPLGLSRSEDIARMASAFGVAGGTFAGVGALTGGVVAAVAAKTPKQAISSGALSGAVAGGALGGLLLRSPQMAITGAVLGGVGGALSGVFVGAAKQP